MRSDSEIFERITMADVEAYEASLRSGGGVWFFPESDFDRKYCYAIHLKKVEMFIDMFVEELAPIRRCIENHG